MRQLVISTATILITGMIATAPMKQAKADGGVTALIVVGYLAADYFVGHKCGYRDWPFNIVTKVTRTKPCRYAPQKQRPRKR